VRELISLRLDVFALDFYRKDAKKKTTLMPLYKIEKKHQNRAPARIQDQARQ